MRVLCVGNMYPPQHLGGYELVWRSAVEHLRAAGHTARVLTTDTRFYEDAHDDPDVHRELRWYWEDHAFPRRSWSECTRIERHNAAALDDHLADLDPHVVAWWSMGGMSLALLERARRRGLPAVAFVHDDWLVYGPHVDGWLRRTRWPGAARLAEALTGLPAQVDFAGAARYVFVSDATRRASLAARGDLPDTGIAHSGIDPRFLERRAAEREWSWRLVYVGRLDERKGLDTVIEAMAQLPAEAVLDVVGAGNDDERRRVEAHAETLGVADRVRFAGPRDRDDLPAIYAEADVAVFPVRWEEPWGLVPLEAMAVGRAVVATGQGGSAEYLRDGENALLFPPGDAPALAEAVGRLADDRGLRARLRAGGFAAAALHTEPAFNAAVEAELAMRRR